MIVQIVADIVGVDVEVILTSEPSKAIDGSFPYLETEDGSIISQTEAIAKHIARMNLASGLIGVHAFDHAKINEWIAWAQTTFIGPLHESSCQLWGMHSSDDAVFNQCVKKMKEQAKILDKWLNGKKWITGETFSIADIFLGSLMIPAFQMMFDPGFRKAMPNLTKWFDSFCLDPFVQRRYGAIKPCQKALKPAGVKAEKCSGHGHKQAPPKEAPKK